MSRKNRTIHYNARNAWIFMATYWAAGFLIALAEGYTSKLTIQITPYTMLVLVLSLLCQHFLSQRYSGFARKRLWVPIIIFAACNGFCETMIFLGVYDIAHQIQLEHKFATFALGFTLFTIYSALIHAHFWLPHAFPPHVKPDAPPFTKTGLPYLIIMSISWFLLYETQGEVLSICIIHFMIDAWAASIIRLPSPFFTVYVPALYNDPVKGVN